MNIKIRSTYHGPGGMFVATIAFVALFIAVMAVFSFVLASGLDLLRGKMPYLPDLTVWESFVLLVLISIIGSAFSASSSRSSS